MMTPKYKAIDFFCGGGGMTCGLRQAGINVIAGVDFDQDAKETYEYNNPGSVFIQTNIKSLRSNYFERKFGIRKNDDFLIMVGCSPSLSARTLEYRAFAQSTPDFTPECKVGCFLICREIRASL